MGKTTRLDAVNTIISNIGQAPVNSLDSGNPMVELAGNVLEEVNRSVQSEGWHCNTEYDFPFTPNESDEIAIPSNALSLDTTPRSSADVVERGGKLYDKEAHSFKFTETQYLTVVWLEDFDDLPEAFKKYVTARAANLFAGRTLGSQEAVMFGQNEELYARAALMEYETNQADYNIFQGSDRSRHYDPFRPIDVMIRRS
jgi:hypothetical protein